MSARVAVDIGGTFTDVVTVDAEHGIRVGKSLSTPTNLVEGILTGLASAQVPVEDVGMLLHGSTVVINALIERKGARAALVTTAGFRDVYEIGRVNRPDAFNLAFQRPRPLIPRDLVFEVDERIRADGTVHRALDRDAVVRLARRLGELGVESVAVCLLHAYRNPDHELAVAELLTAELPGVFITTSHELSREYREYERTSTVAANAFVGPLLDGYLRELDALVSPQQGVLTIMQSNGGLADVERIRRQGIQMLESGPAGGVVGTIDVCRALGLSDAIAFDMGGTTAKSSVIRDLTFPTAAEYFVGGYASGLPVRVPCLDIVEVGTGGGSIAAVDAGGQIRVGPRSAGSEPGPACYGRGGDQATVTDACAVLGIIDPNGTLSGGLALDGAAAERVVRRVADDLGLSLEGTAAGIVRIAAASMANSVRAVTTERGLDPQDFTMVAYGGNGPVHASLVARELGVRSIVIPTLPSVFSAVGMLLADLRHDVALTEWMSLEGLDLSGLGSRLDALAAECAEALERGGLSGDRTEFSYALDMRYVGQEHVLMLPIARDLDAGALADAFHAAHLQRFGHSAPGKPVEIVGLRVSASRPIPRIVPPVLEPGDGDPSRARRGSRAIGLEPDGGAVECTVYDRDGLRAGDVIEGPAAIEEPTTTTILRPGDSLVVDPTGALVITVGGSR